MSKVKRLDPLNPEVSSVKTQVTANNNSINNVDCCPVCDKQMRLLECNGIPSFVCLEHRVALPCKDA